MEKTPEQLFAQVQGIAIAHNAIFKMLIPVLIPDVAARKALRDQICDAMEAMYEHGGLKPHGHFALQAAMSEVERLFAS